MLDQLEKLSEFLLRNDSAFVIFTNFKLRLYYFIDLIREHIYYFSYSFMDIMLLSMFEIL